MGAEGGRSWNAVFTRAGLDRLRQAWPTYLASMRTSWIISERSTSPR